MVCAVERAGPAFLGKNTPPTPNVSPRPVEENRPVEIVPRDSSGEKENKDLWAQEAAESEEGEAAESTPSVHPNGAEPQRSKGTRSGSAYLHTYG